MVRQVAVASTVLSTAGASAAGPMNVSGFSKTTVNENGAERYESSA